MWYNASKKENPIMVTITLCCSSCGSEDLVRNGHATNGKQMYRCKACKRQSRENPAPNGYTDERREEIIKAYQERSSMRGLTRTFGVARNTVKDWLKKSRQAPSLERNVACT
jgi:transposase-like protein